MFAPWFARESLLTNIDFLPNHFMLRRSTENTNNNRGSNHANFHSTALTLFAVYSGY